MIMIVGVTNNFQLHVLLFSYNVKHNLKGWNIFEIYFFMCENKDKTKTKNVFGTGQLHQHTSP